MLKRYVPPVDWIGHVQWLVHQLTRVDGRLLSLSAKDVDRFGLDLMTWSALHQNHASLAVVPTIERVNTWLMRLGLQRAIWQDKPCAKSLPMLGIHPQQGLCLVTDAAPSSGKWPLLTPNGSRDWTPDETGWLFCSLNLGWREQLRLGGLGLAVRVIMRHRWPLFGLWLSTALANSALALVAWWWAVAFPQPLVGLDGLALVLLAFAVAIGVGMTAVLDAMRRWINLRLTQNLDAELAQEIFERLLKMRTDQSSRSADSLATQLQLFESVRLFMYTMLTMLLFDIPMALVFWWVIQAQCGAALAAVPAAFALIKLGQGGVLFYRIKRWLDDNGGGQHTPTALMLEIIECAQTLNRLSLRSVFQHRWQEAIRDQVRQDRKVQHLSQIALNENHGLRQIGFVVWLWVSVQVAAQGAGLSLGMWVACTMLVTRVVHPVSALPALCLQWLQAQWALRQIDQICKLQVNDDKAHQTLKPGMTQGQILLHDVSYAPTNRLDDLRISHWLVHPGERVALVGDMGGGKSTLLKLVAGLYKPQRGQVLIDQVDVQHWPRHVLSDKVAYLPQNVPLFSGTLRDNLLAGLSNVSDDQLIDVCQRVGLLSFVNAHPQGLDMPMQDGPHGLSAGQRKLVGLARVVIHQPLIWLLDDPLANLDEPLQQRVVALLQESITPQQTLIAVGHQAALLSMVDRVTVMRAGRLILDGPRHLIQKQWRS